jgi:arylsulfatase B
MSEKLLPQHFKEAGYSTSLIGKWHLGMSKKQYWPTKRGYDSFFGYLGTHIDYWNYTLLYADKNWTRGLDMRRNEEPQFGLPRVYATDMFTNEAKNQIKNHDKSKPLFMMINHLAPHAGNEDTPMQAPQEEIDKFSYISNVKRRTCAGENYILSF